MCLDVVFDFESHITRTFSTGNRHMKNNEFCDIMPIKEICVSPTEKRSFDEDKFVDSESKAMLQSLGSSYPAVAQNGSPPSLSSPSSNYDICRICHCEAEINAPLIAPCYCSGSLLYVHQSCLQQWIKSSDTRKCELCKFEFIMQTKLKPFTQWERLDITAVERRKIFCSVTFHVVAITCVVWSLYVLIDRTAEEVRSGILEWPFWTKLIVVAIGFTGGLVFMYVQCKMYVHLCRRWKAYNRIIYIQSIQNAPIKSMLASGTLNDNNFNSSTRNSVQTTTDHAVPHFPSSKCDSAVTNTPAATAVVTCIDISPSQFVVPESKVTNTTTSVSTPISPLPPPTSTLTLPLILSSPMNSLANNDNNDENCVNSDEQKQSYLGSIYPQMEKIS